MQTLERAMRSKPGSSGQMHEYEARLTLKQEANSCTASIQDPELLNPYIYHLAGGNLCKFVF